MKKLNAFSVLFALLISGTSAWPHNKCSDLLLGHQELTSALKEVRTTQDSQMVVLSENADPLDHTVLGPEGKEILAKLDNLMVGHHDVKLALASAVQRAASGAKNPNRPIATILLLGVTGTGKSLTAEALAEALNGDPNKKITIDCGEVQSDHEIAKITGSPAGYVGHGKTEPLITQEKLDQVTSQQYGANVVLVDELEKGAPALQRLLLGILDKGQMSTGTNAQVDFSNSIVIMTSNLGQSQMQSILGADSKPAMGFSIPKVKTEESERNKELELDAAARAAATAGLSPEFRNRIDKTFVFKQPTKEESLKMLNMSMAAAHRKVFLSGNTAPILFQLSQDARDYILSDQYSPEFGGRSLRRTVDDMIVAPLINLIAAQSLKAGDVVSVSLNGKQFAFRKVASGLSQTELGALYKKLYGMDLPPLKIRLPVSSGNAAVSDDEAAVDDGTAEFYTKGQFSVLVGRLILEQDANRRLWMIGIYTMLTPELTDDQFLTLLKLMPAGNWSVGFKKSDLLSAQMKQMKFGNWARMEIEPAPLRIFWFGMSRLKTLAHRNRTEMTSAIDQMVNETQAVLSKAGLSNEFISQVLSMLRQLHSTVMNLPAPIEPE